MVKVIRASVLVLLLACAAQAGEMQNGLPQPPPPPQTNSADPTPPVEGEEAEGDVPDDVTNTLTEAALSVLNNVLALL